MRPNHAGRIILLIALAALAGVPAHSQTPVQPLGEKYALLVGVRKYPKSSALRDLQYTERDMDELATVLRGGGYRPENIVVMTGTAGAVDPRFLPTLDHIRLELKALLRDRIEADSVVVAFAGHGLQFVGSDENYFCPADARSDNTATLLSLKEVYGALEGCKAQFKLLLSDACRNDPIAAAARRASSNFASVTRPQLQRPPGGVAALFSCSEGELAFENDTLKHGVFFNFVIEGLRGAADFDKDLQVGLQELSQFATRRVLDFVRAEYDGLRQMPVLKGEVGGLPVLVSLKPARVPDAARVERSPIRPTVPGEPKVIPKLLGIRMLQIPAGAFDMGSPDQDEDERPRHQVVFTRPFYLGACEVTQAQYRAVMGKNPSYNRRSDHLPVENVSWEDATAFCNALSKREGLKPYYLYGPGAQSGGSGYRLPTEAEWEYACRAGSTTEFGFRDEDGTLDNYCWLRGNSYGFTQPVGQKRPNAFGLYDMHGNVEEWCWDAYGAGYYEQSPGVNPLGPAEGKLRVFRGGSYAGNSQDARAANRENVFLLDRSFHRGFRVARSRLTSE